ncbi:exporter of polyketide antibiotics [Paeniglutamicibacter psychrophenolicus]|uniref:ABC-2 type transport system permease protein n=1 Tax=Paeniglutamicibacter psychrophenolicus TaxID=257454 RepID=A0ABS4WFF2_9MICC|nr:ABC transporter permease [Paeniglutamicibacter psychrophenolicus]MBP2374905.1 ABC-2 type transport system permease protein [Paeniglutamicibacter psychrophenolicus]
MSSATALGRAARGTSVSTGSLAGVGTAVRFILRRNWLRLVIWAAVLAVMIPIVYGSQQEAFPTQAARDAYAQVANTPAVAAMTGLPYAAGSLGGILVIKIWMTLAVALGFASIFLVTRNGRADEETGRTELLRSAALGRHAYSVANYLVAGSLSVLTGLLVSLLCLSLALPTGGSWAMGASIAGTGLAFVAISAICGQLATTSRGANSLAVALLALFYFIRAGADLQANGTDPSALSWFSPIGWAQNMRSFGQDNWWPLLALLGLAVLGCALALRLGTRRDLGAGILPERGGPATASALLANPLGLVLRLQRSSLVGWFLGAVVAGLFFGSVAKAMTSVLDPNNPFAKSFVGAGHDMLDGVMGIFVLFNGLLAGAFAVQALAGARSEEESGRLESQLAGSLSRFSWLWAHVLVAGVGSAAMLLVGGYLTGVSSQGASTGGAMAAASFAYWPAVLLMLGVLLFCQGFIPRPSTGIAWAVYGLSVMAAMFGGLFSLSEDVIKATPFGAVPRLPAEDFALLPLVVLGVVALVLATIGFWRFRARDLMPE